MASDRLLFETFHLNNGMTIYHRPMDVPFAHVSIVVPVGHAHNTGAIPKGAAHFLEHMACKRCRAYPEAHALHRHFGLNGGISNAATSMYDTSYLLNVSAELFRDDFLALKSRVFEPVFDEEGIARERTIIRNERMRKGKWFPGNDEISHYLLTQWMSRNASSVRQRFGEDEDLAAINCKMLDHIHSHYFDRRAYVLMGGSADLDFVAKELSEIQTGKLQLEEVPSELQWINRTYHEKAFDDARQYTYHLGGTIVGEGVRGLVGMRLMRGVLVNSALGVLYQWLRNQLGWCYNILASG